MKQLVPAFALLPSFGKMLDVDGHHQQKLLTTSHAAEDVSYIAAEAGGL